MVVVAAQADGLLRKGLGRKLHRLFGREGPALQHQAVLRCGRQRLPVPRLHRAQVTLGVHVQADGLQHRVGQQAAQERNGHVLVQVILLGRVTPRRQQVAQVVQQGGHHGGRGFARLFGPLRALQCVLQLAHCLAAVLVHTTGSEQLGDVFKAQCHRLSLSDQGLADTR